MDEAGSTGGRGRTSPLTGPVDAGALQLVDPDPTGETDATAPDPVRRRARPAHSAAHRGTSGRRGGGLWAATWDGTRWVASTSLVAASAYFVGFLGLWAASWISRGALAATAVRWDGTWYYAISEFGYVSAVPKAANQYAALRPAFFPGLPLAEHAVHDVIGGVPAATTLLVGAVGLVASCLLLRALVARELNDEVAWRATVIFAFFPGSYVFLMGYSEALAIPLAILALYALRRRWYLIAGLATAAATATRLLGVALVVACAIAALHELYVVVRRHERRRWFTAASAVASPFIGVTGLVGFMVYLHEKTGSYFTFETAERIGWANSISFSEPYRAFQEFARNPFTTPFVTLDVIGVVVVVACLVFLAVSGWRLLPLEDVAYAAVILLAWLFTANTGAWFRFVLSAFPVLTLLAAKLDRRWYPTFACAGAALLGILLVLFGTAVSFSP